MSLSTSSPSSFSDTFKYRFEILKQEIDILQSGIRTYDTSLMTLKQWVITLTSGLLAYSTQVETNQPFFMAANLGAVLLFWFIDGYYKSVQRIYIIRYQQIEASLRDGSMLDALQTGDWSKTCFPDLAHRFQPHGIKDRWRRLFQEGVFNFSTYVFYVPVLIILLVLSFLIWSSAG